VEAAFGSVDLPQPLVFNVAEVTDLKTKEVKNYHTALNFKPKEYETIFRLKLT
jgi:hypothetical protein